MLSHTQQENIKQFFEKYEESIKDRKESSEFLIYCKKIIAEIQLISLDADNYEFSLKIMLHHIWKVAKTKYPFFYLEVPKLPEAELLYKIVDEITNRDEKTFRNRKIYKILMGINIKDNMLDLDLPDDPQEIIITQDLSHLLDIGFIENQLKPTDQSKPQFRDYEFKNFTKNLGAFEFNQLKIKKPELAIIVEENRLLDASNEGSLSQETFNKLKLVAEIVADLGQEVTIQNTLKVPLSERVKKQFHQDASFKEYMTTFDWSAERDQFVIFSLIYNHLWEHLANLSTEDIEEFKKLTFNNGNYIYNELKKVASGELCTPTLNRQIARFVYACSSIETQFENSHIKLISDSAGEKQGSKEKLIIKKKKEKFDYSEHHMSKTPIETMPVYPPLDHTSLPPDVKEKSDAFDLQKQLREKKEDEEYYDKVMMQVPSLPSYDISSGRVNLLELIKSYFSQLKPASDNYQRALNRRLINQIFEMLRLNEDEKAAACVVESGKQVLLEQHANLIELEQIWNFYKKYPNLASKFTETLGKLINIAKEHIESTPEKMFEVLQEEVEGELDLKDTIQINKMIAFYLGKLNPREDQERLEHKSIDDPELQKLILIRTFELGSSSEKAAEALLSEIKKSDKATNIIVQMMEDQVVINFSRKYSLIAKELFAGSFNAIEQNIQKSINDDLKESINAIKIEYFRYIDSDEATHPKVSAITEVPEDKNKLLEACSIIKKSVEALNHSEIGWFTKRKIGKEALEKIDNALLRLITDDNIDNLSENLESIKALILSHSFTVGRFGIGGVRLIQHNKIVPARVAEIYKIINDITITDIQEKAKKIAMYAAEALNHPKTAQSADTKAFYEKILESLATQRLFKNLQPK